MKTILMSLLLAAAPPCFSMAVACACDKGDSVKKRVYVTADAKKPAKAKAVAKAKAIAKAHNVYVTSGDNDEKIFKVKIDGECKDGRSEAKAIWVGEDGKTFHLGGDDSGLVWIGGGPSADVEAKVVAKVKSKARAKARAKAKKSGWLGVSIDTVPDVLARQFDLDHEGVIVVNVVGESPADRAGFQVHDVILEINGEVVKGLIGQAVDLIKSRGPGEEVEVVVMRGGDIKPITVELGSRADVEADALEFKFEGAPLAEVEERIKTRGKILRKGQGGKWVMEDLGDLKLLKDLPKQIEMLIPKSGSRSTQLHMTGDERKITTTVESDGETIIITGAGDGPIKVIRIDQDGNKTKMLYEDEDELEESDTGAFEVWEDVGDTAVLHLNLDAIEIPDIDIEIPEINIEIPDIDIPDIDIEIPDFAVEFDAEEWQEHADEWKTELEGSLGEARESYEQAMEQYKEAMEQWREGKVEVKEWPNVFFSGEGEPKSAWMKYAQQAGKPKHTFEVGTDGSIEVRIQKGDSELVQLYEDGDDMARRSPKLYKKYKKLMGLERE